MIDKYVQMCMIDKWAWSINTYKTASQHSLLLKALTNCILLCVTILQKQKCQFNIQSLQSIKYSNKSLVLQPLSI